jgi:hypothetical protein
MVDVKTETKPQTETKPVNPRDAIREARQRRLRVVAGNNAATVKVYPANETMRGVLHHPNGKIRFRQELDQPVEWPNDSFTKRRIAEGSVLTDGPGSGEAAEPDESLNAREHAEANKPKKKEEAKETNGKSEQNAAPKPQSQPQPPAA